MFIDPRDDISTIWAALEAYQDSVLDAPSMERGEARKQWDDICGAMARITESLGYDPLELD
jgi:hypothetical protein